MDLIIQQWNVEDVKPYEANSKIHDAAQVQKIANSIREFGWDQPVVVDRHGVIIKGHGRTEAAKLLGLATIPVLVRDDLNEEQVRAARLADNRVAIGDIDTTLLQQELQSLNFSLEGIFDDKELAFLDANMFDVNLDAIVVDLDEEVSKQAEETIRKIEETDARPVRIDKALGFKEIKGEDERAVARFMAVAEGETGKEGAEAFIEYIQRVM